MNDDNNFFKDTEEILSKRFSMLEFLLLLNDDTDEFKKYYSQYFTPEDNGLGKRPRSYDDCEDEKMSDDSDDITIYHHKRPHLMDDTD